ncbi:MAG: cache domain-containing protein [Deltaproteobacteria bacterium]|nr:cache domain-containing protein [Deltaproteobacteria bacterium]
MSPRLRGWYRNAAIRYKLLVAYSLAFTLLLGAGCLVTYGCVRRAVELRIESQLTNSTSGILNLVRTSASASIRNYLRAVADRNAELVQRLWERHRRGELTEDEAKREAAEVMLSQTIGRTGYVCCADSRGVLLVHPDSGVLGRDFSELAFVREVNARRSGYLEYDWTNPPERAPRPKAMFMRYFEPWDWIIVASAYRDEFSQLLNVEDFRASVASLRFGKTGHAYILDSDGRVILHPHGGTAEEHLGPGAVAEMQQRRTGKLVYSARGEGSAPRERLVVYNRLPEYGWIVASSIDLDEVYAPLRELRTIFVLAAIGSLLLVVPLSLRIAASIAGPLQRLAQELARSAPGDVSPRRGGLSGDEVGQLARHFDRFMKDVTELRRLEREVIDTSDRERRNIGHELHDDLGPHLIGIDALAMVLQKKLGDGSDAAKSVGEIRGLIGEAIQKSRALARGLCPVRLVDAGLTLALAELAAQTRAVHGIPCEVRSEGDASAFDPSAATQLFYIAREAVHNAVKHSGASLVTVGVYGGAGEVRLRVADDGRGIEAGSEAQGMGLRIMRYRARAIGATLVIRSAPAQGTSVSLKLPGPGAAEEAG